MSSCIVPNKEFKDLEQDIINEIKAKPASWGRFSNNGYEVSTAGDSRFSALNAKFKEGTIIDGVDVGGYTIEEVYQTLIKQGKLSHDWKSGKGKAPSPASKLHKLLGREPNESVDQINYTHEVGYKPLWELWARQNPDLIEELRQKSQGKVLTDKFSDPKKTVSQARALYEILTDPSFNNSSTSEKSEAAKVDPNKTEQLGVVIDKDLMDNYTDWQEENPDGIVAYRVDRDYATPEAVENGIIGNPFSVKSRGKETVDQFRDWLITGNNYGNVKATEELRQAIIEKILNSEENTPILYYKELGRPSHATVIGELINNKSLLNRETYDNSKAAEEYANYSQEDLRVVIINFLNEFCDKKGIEKEEWVDYKDAAKKYVQARLNGENPRVTTITGVDYFYKRVQKTIKFFNSIVRRSPNFEEDHTYIVRINGKEVEVSNTVSSVANAGAKEITNENVKKNGEVGKALGNSIDALVRDFFRKDKKGNSLLQGYMHYNNLSQDVYNSLVKELNKLNAYFASIYKDGFKVISDPFAIAAVYGRYNTPIAGEMDLLLIDAHGGVHIYDVKTNSTQQSAAEKENYRRQLYFYSKIFYPAFRKALGENSNITENVTTHIIEFKTTYPKWQAASRFRSAQKGCTVDADGTIYYGRKPLRLLTDPEEYGVTFNVYSDKKTGIKSNIYDNMSTYSAETEYIFNQISAEEKQALKDMNDPHVDALILELANIKTSDAVTTVLSNSKGVELDTLQSADIISPSKLNEYSHTAACALITILNEIRTDPKAAAEIFWQEAEEAEEKGETFSLVGKSYEEILSKPSRIIDLMRDVIFRHFDRLASTLNRAKYKASGWLEEHLDIFTSKTALYFRDITGITLKTAELDFEDTVSESGSEEVDGRQPWAINAMEVKLEDTVTGELRSLLGIIQEGEWANKGTAENPIFKQISRYEDKLFEDAPIYLEPKTVLQKINALIHTCKTSEQMVQKIKDKINEIGETGLMDPKNAYLPYLYNLLKEHPELKAQLFRSFRKNKSTFVTVESKRVKRDGVTAHETGSYDLMQTQARKQVARRLYGNIDSGESILFDLDEKGYLFTVDKRVLDRLKSMVDRENIRQLRWTSEKIDVLSTVLRDIGFGDFSEELYSMDYNRIHVYFKHVRSLLEATTKFAYGIRFNPKSDILNKYGQSAFTDLINEIAKIAPVDYSASVYSNGKQYSVYNTPSYIGDLIEMLSDYSISSSEYAARIEAVFGKSKLTKHANGKYVSTWLNMLVEDINNNEYGHKAQLKRLIEVLNNKETYSNMNISTYPKSTILEYFAPAFSKSQHDILNRRFFIPIMSDKSACEYISFSATSFEDAITDKDSVDEEKLNELKSVIARELYSFVQAELVRMKDILADTRNPNHIHLNNFDINLNDASISAELREKLSTKKTKSNATKLKITHDDLLDANDKTKLAKWVTNSGMSFKYLGFLNDLLVDPNNAFTKAFLSILNNSAKEFTANQLNAIEEAIFQGMEKEANSYVDEMLSDPIMEKEISDLIPPSYLYNVRVALSEQYWNQTLASCNIFNLTIGDLSFYKNSTDVQKRFAQVHSMVERVDPTASFIDSDGSEVRYSDGKHRCLFVKETKVYSRSLKQIENCFKSIIKSKKAEIRRVEGTDLAKKAALEKELRSVVGFFNRAMEMFKEGWDETDGQAFITVEGYFKRLGMLGYDTTEIKKAIDRIRRGKNWDIHDLDIVLNPFKPFVYTKEVINRANGPVEIPVQIKNSECLLFIAGMLADRFIADGLIEKEVEPYIDEYGNPQYRIIRENPLIELTRLVSETHYNADGSWRQDGIDTIVFSSNVKSGLHKEVSNDFLYGEDVQGDDIASIIANRDQYVHTYPWDNWGKQQEVPAHAQDSEQAMPSQGRALITAFIKEDEIFTIPKNANLLSYFNKADYTVNGKHAKITGATLMKVFDKLIAEDMEQGLGEWMKMFNLKYNEKGEIVPAFGEDATNENLSNYLQSQLLNDSRASFEEYKAMGLEDGKFNIPLGDPTAADKVASTIFSSLKKMVNKEKMPGGFYVQSSAIGLSSKMDLQINKKTGKLEYMPMIVTFPNARLERLMTNPDGSIMAIEDAIKNGYLREQDLKAIIERIPTENKISTYAAKIVGFLPRSHGERAIVSREGVLLAGWDFDIDKLNITFRHKYNMNDVKKRKNAIFDLQYMALTSRSAFEDQFTPQDFTPLKEIAALIGNKENFGNRSIVDPRMQYFYQNSNMVGKKMVAISASNNSSHALLNKAGMRIKIPTMTINGYTFSDRAVLDPKCSPVDGMRIDRVLGMLLGASADNAKEAIVNSINYTPVTANMYTSLIRLGVPLKTTALIFSLPRVSEMIKQAQQSDMALESIIALYSDSQEAQGASNFEINDEDLLLAIKNGGNANLESGVIGMLANFVSVANSISRISDIAKLNSTKNAVGPTVFDTLKTYMAIKNFFEKEANNEKSLFLKEDIDNLIDTIPYLKPLINCYMQAIPALTEKHFTGMSPSFLQLADYLQDFGINISNMSTKSLRKMHNQFMVYTATAMRDADGNKIVDGSKEGRFEIFFKTPLAILQAKRKVGNSKILSAIQVDKKSGKYNVGKCKVDTGILTRAEIEELTASWAALHDEGNTNSALFEEISKLLIDYHIFRGGFAFMTEGFLTIAPNVAKKRYKNGAYIQATDASYYTAQPKEFYRNFMIQYLRNNSYGQGVISLSKEDIDAGVHEFSPGNYFRFRRSDSTRKELLVSIDGTLYAQSEENPNVYVFVDKLGFNKQGFEYNAEEDGTKMHSVNNATEFAAYNKMWENYLGEMERERKEWEESEAEDEIDDEENDYSSTNISIAAQSKLELTATNKQVDEYMRALDNEIMEDIMTTFEDIGHNVSEMKEAIYGEDHAERINTIDTMIDIIENTYYFEGDSKTAKLEYLEELKKLC